MKLESVLHLLVAIGSAGFLLGSLWQLRGRPGSLLTATSSAPSRMDRLALACTWVGITFAAVSVSIARFLRGSALLPLHVPVIYIVLVGVILVVGPLALLRRRSRCPTCSRTIVPENECPYCETGDGPGRRDPDSRVF